MSAVEAAEDGTTLHDIAEAIEGRGRALITQGEGLVALAEQIRALAPGGQQTLSVVVADPPEPVAEPEPEAEQPRKTILDGPTLRTAPPPAEPKREPPPLKADGKPTILKAMQAALELRTFSRKEFAERLGIKPLGASKWIEELRKRQMVTADGTTFVTSSALNQYVVSNFAALKEKSGDEPDFDPEALVEQARATVAREPTDMPENLRWLPAAKREARVSEVQAQKDIADFIHGHADSTVPGIAKALNRDQILVARLAAELVSAGHVSLEVDRYNAPPEEQKDAGSALADRVRGFVVTQTGEFSLREATTALDMPADVVSMGLAALAERGVVEDVSPGPDLPLFRYTPYGPDKPTVATGTASAPRRNSTPVAGTGKQLKVGNKDVRELVEQAQRAGAHVEHAANGHFLVLVPQDDGSTKRVLIAATPRNPRTVLNDKARLRKAGLALVG